MSTTGGIFAAAARELVGTPFCLHGRSREAGVDCVGLVTLALQHIGYRVRAPRDYGLRNQDHSRFLGAFEEAGFTRCNGLIEAGDVLLVNPGPAQIHLLIATGSNSFVHAHAGIRRVVHLTGPHGWPELGHWRLRPEKKE